MSTQSSANREAVIGIDVGTGSARAGVFDLAGTMLAAATQPIQIWRPAPDFAEQSSVDIWEAVARAVRQAMADAGLPPGQVRGLSFDATCSLVALDAADRPVSVSPTGAPEQNIILWMDHRAIAETDWINGRGHRVLRYVGGRLSPEMETPKLLWLKKNLPQSWRQARRFLDLADFLTYRATGRDVRSLCTTVCKWTYLGHEERWDRSYFDAIGLAELLEQDRIGAEIWPMGTRLGGLTEAAARDLGLTPATQVGVGIIDAHAGGLGVLGMRAKPARTLSPVSLERALALIGGTSSCHMAVSREPRFVRGVWGPYFSAMVPGMWLTEGGQSATGALLDHVIASHARSRELEAAAGRAGLTIYQVLNAEVERLQAKDPYPTRHVHVLPYFHGNRSPRANPHLRGAVSGLALDDSLQALALQYYATIQAIAYGTRHIIEAMNQKGYRIGQINACGGGTKNPLWLQEHADITGCSILLPGEPEAVLLGTAMLGAVAAGVYRSVPEAMARMSRLGGEIRPQRRTRAFHDAKYRAFHQMYRNFVGLHKIMS